MSFTESMQRIAAWLDREEEALLYEPDCGEAPSVWSAAIPQAADRFLEGIADRVFPMPLSASRYRRPYAVLRWPADDSLGLPTPDASEEALAELTSTMYGVMGGRPARRGTIRRIALYVGVATWLCPLSA